MHPSATNDLINIFWQSFSENELTYRRIIDDNDPDLIDAILNRLMEIQRGLAVEFEKNNSIYCMTISADGVEENFDIVQKIIQHSPAIENWQFNALRQPYSKDRINKLVITVNGHSLDPKKIMFLPIVEEEKLYIQIFSADITEENINEIGYGCLMLLDNIIGEYACVKKVYGYEYYNLSEASGLEDDLQPLTELGEFLESYYSSTQ
ncbi:hypothetical protein KJS94_10520 [Flavihumibacter rivuli]|uniref:hypothetical protein n=1 Tax=Flavihumibacter rivuli TaxID=2838156 RepID=UPI001BDE1AC0|nr:hypothetical protein [Flavihumibacter rivuli]ULQ55073.1 hypothetical protein KJS94_10520 [Flavihumibacter rivuli]